MYLSSHPLDRYRFEIQNFTNCPLSELSSRIEESESKQTGANLSMAGMVTDIKQVTARNGSQGARITLEDYSGNYELALFGKEYETYIAYMKEHANLYLEAETRARYKLKPEEIAENKKAPFIFKIKGITMLGTLCESKLSSLALQMDTTMISKDRRKALVKLLKENSGPTPLLIYLFDEPTRYRLEFFSKKFKVAINDDFLDGLKKLEISYKVNKK